MKLKAGHTGVEEIYNKIAKRNDKKQEIQFIKENTIIVFEQELEDRKLQAKLKAAIKRNFTKVFDYTKNTNKELPTRHMDIKHNDLYYFMHVKMNRKVLNSTQTITVTYIDIRSAL